jgi:hypothetical protein
MIKALVILLLAISKIAFGQKDRESSKTYHGPGIQTEIAGNGGVASAGVEYIYLFDDITKGVYLRGGIGSQLWGGDLTFIESGMLIGKRGKFLDLGLGYSFFDMFSRFHSYGPKEYFWALRLGYRYQGKKGFLFRIAPLYIIKPESDGTDYGFWFGIGIGYTFRLSKKID